MLVAVFHSKLVVQRSRHNMWRVGVRFGFRFR